MSKPAGLERLLDAMTFRCIGPPRGGRVVAVAGDPSDPGTFYFGAVAGGIWKTTDAGTTWQCVSDGFLKTSSVGALEVSAAEPNVIYAGMGETTIRTDVSHGDGVYKSNDGGRTWRHLGLTDTRAIGRIRIHPRDPDTVYVAALGHPFGDSSERGVFRSRDGGESWSKVLFVSERAGAVDLTIDERTPDIVYASFWQARRSPWSMSSGGEDSGLWRSTNGGDHWTNISRARGLPATGLLGKIGVAASPAQAGRIWALIEAQNDPGLYRSDDFGDSWQLVSDNLDLRRRPWYYMHLTADPLDPDTIYVNNLGMHKSSDGGKSFVEIPTPHGDNHALWIDPRNPRRMVQGNDGGANVSFNGGESFSTVHNQLTAQLYHLDTDNRFPYRVYATQQDNSSISVPSDTLSGAIDWGDCYVAGSGESGYVACDPKDDNVVFVGAVGSSPGGLGALQRYDHATGQIRLVNVWPQIYGGDIALKSFKHRFPWTYPILFSPHDPQVLYTCGERVFRSRDDGHSWEAISPDLTRNDVEKQVPSGGPITLDSSAAEHYCTIYTFRESPHEAGVFWAGSDDGLVHLSRDGGATWSNVTPAALPEWAWVRTLEPSPHDPATCYLAATRYKLDDTTPWLFKTNDYGATWTLMTEGIGATDFTRVLRADPARPGVLYAGTETGLYVSVDDGAHWLRWQSNFPVTPVYDLKVRGADLVIATHGRSLWILDDLTPLRTVAATPLDETARILAPATVYRILPDINSDWVPAEGRAYGLGLASIAVVLIAKTELGTKKRTFLTSGEGATHGTVLYLGIPEGMAADAPVSLEILDASGTVVRSFKPKPAGWDKLDDKQKGLDLGPWIPSSPGLHRFVWNLRMEGALKLAGNKTAGDVGEGPFVLPGHYRARLTAGDAVVSAGFEVVNDPRVRATPAELAEQHATLLTIRDTISAAYAAVKRVRDVREQVEGWMKRLADKPEVVKAASAILEQITAVEEALIIPGEQKDTYHLTARPRLNEALSSLVAVVGSSDAPPTTQAAALVEEYASQIRAHIESLDATVTGDVAAFNALVAKTGVPAVIA